LHASNSLTGFSGTKFALYLVQALLAGDPTMRSTARGFTLIELMIVVAIIAILAAIALPAYNAYRIKAADRACLGEAKAYTTSWVAASVAALGLPNWVAKACKLPASGTGAATVPGSFSPVDPGTATISCNPATASCS
jgi:type IV pilus assembly protein PilA